MEQPQPSRTFFDGINDVFLNDRGLRAGWRLLVFFGILLLIFFFALFITGASTHPPRSAPASELARQMPQLLVKLGFFLAVLLASWLMTNFERRPLGAFGLPLQRAAMARFLRGYLLWGFLPLAVLLMMMRVLGVFYFGTFSNFDWTTLSWGLFWGGFFLLVGLGEEYLFRGYAQFTLADGIGFWPAAVILSILFASAHLLNKGETRIGIVSVVAFGLFAAATLWRTGNLWLAVGAHAGWDWGQTFFFGVSDSGFLPPGHLLNPHAAGPDWLSGGTVGPEGSALTLILLVLMTALFLALYRRPREPVAMITPTESMK